MYLRDTGAMLCQLSYEATHWERGQLIEFISSHTVKCCEVSINDDQSSLSSVTTFFSSAWNNDHLMQLDAFFSPITTSDHG